MDGHNRQRARSTQWDHQRPSFTPATTPHQHKQSGPSVDAQSLDQFLSGINTERNKDSHQRAGNATHVMRVPPNATPHDRPPDPPQHPSQQWDTFVDANRAWQTPYPGSGEGQQQSARTPPGSSHQNEQEAAKFDRRDLSNSARPETALWHESEMANSERAMQKFPVPVDTSSARQQYQHEQTSSSYFSREKPHPLAPPNSNWCPPEASDGRTNQTHAQFQGPGFQGTHPPPSNTFIPHLQQSLEPHQPLPRPSGPHPTGPHPPRPHPPGSHPPGLLPFEHPGEFGFPPQPFQPSPNFSGPRPAGQHPRGPHPSHPVQSSGPPHFHPNPRQLHPGVAPDPLSSEPNLAPPPQHCDSLRPRPPPKHQVTLQEVSQRKLDEDWLKGWLRKNRIGQSESRRETKSKPISIDEGRRLVVELLQALHQLGQQRDMLSSHINRDESTWQYECRRVNRSKERVELLQARLFSTEFQLHRKMKKIGKKRARLKRRRLEDYQRQEDVEARRKEIHLKIDAELAKRLHAEQEKKKEAELQEEVDKTLFEVRKKKQEVAQMLDLINGLRKLRHLRKEAAQAKGVFTPRESDISFDESLKPLEELMGKQSILYQEEERVMQVMLEEEHEEYKEQEKKRQRKRLEEKAIKEMHAKMKLLFGKEDLARPDDPMFPFQQFYHQADSSIPALLGIRRQWDQFLVPDTDPEGSPIPASWVLPSDPSSSAWASMLDS